MKTIKIRDLPRDTNLGDCYVDGARIISQWSKGLWVRRNPKDTQVHPIFFENLDELLDMEVTINPE